MPGGTRRSGRTTARAKTQEVGNINVSAPPHIQESKPKGAKSKSATKSRPAKARPSQASQRTRKKVKATLGKDPTPPRVTSSRVEEQNRQRDKRLQHRRARRHSPTSSARVRRESSSKPASASQTQIPSVRDARTQTVAISNRNVSVQTDPPTENRQQLVQASLTQRNLRQLRRELHTIKEWQQAIDLGDTSSDDSSMARRNTVTTGKTYGTGNNTSADPAFRDKLLQNGILEQQFMESPDQGSHIRPNVPQNYAEIWAAIQKDRPHSPGLTLQEYRKYTMNAFESNDEDSTSRHLFDPFLATNAESKEGHGDCTTRWINHLPIMRDDVLELTRQPKADYCEGIKTAIISKNLHRELPSCIVVGGLAFPNFIAELKRHGSTFVAHAQNRHNGAVASQAWHDYYEDHLKMPDASWNIARVGSMEFNGDTVVGNVHWVSKETTPDGKPLNLREFHMTRVLNRFTFGLGFEDFKLARKEARNFRDYFFEVRDALVTELQQQTLREKVEKYLEVPQSPSQNRSQPRTQSRRGRGRPPRAASRGEHVIPATSETRGLDQELESLNGRNPGEDVESQSAESRSCGRKRRRESAVSPSTSTKKTKRNTSTHSQ